jgi:uncharacterized Tic20 family protein
MGTQTTNSLLGTEEQPPYMPTSDERTMAILSHILTFVAPFLAPLIIYLIKKDESKFVEWHAKESLNFQITLVIICIILVLTVVGIFFLWFVGIAAMVLVIVASVRASESKLYRYPFSIRLIK